MKIHSLVVVVLVLTSCKKEEEPKAELPTKTPVKHVHETQKPKSKPESKPTPKARPKLNRLSKEKSLYLRQHGTNPVDWFPWGEEAFEKAKKENKPVFLSIGYSSCHWCHVMEHESFADEEVAAIMNEHFVCIKVDREERPDVDEVYMSAAQAMRMGGGWPLSVWMTPTGKPFMAGTYFPKRRDPRMGNRPGFIDVLEAIAKAWNDPADRPKIEAQGERVAEVIQMIYDAEEPDEISVEAIKTARFIAEQMYDSAAGGFSSPPQFAPKFPSPSTAEFFLRYALRHDDKKALEMVTHTLTQMAWGGIHDHIGGGFHRYSTTRDWLVPHFEKMLYDNGQLLGLYSWAYLVTKDEHYAATARDIAAWVQREMTDETGGFFAAQDADDPGGPEGEGGFYVWNAEGIEAVVGAEAAKPVVQRFGIKPAGNWHEKPGMSLLQVLDRTTAFDAASREKMYVAREKRPKPITDEKLLTGWNGLMISGFCRSYQALGEKSHLESALRAATFIAEKMTAEDGRLHRRWAGGEPAHNGVLADYAYMIAAYLDLYETTFDQKWLELALNLNKLAVKLFYDEKEGGFFFTAAGGEQLIARGKPGLDNARPSGNGTMAFNLIRCAELTGDMEHKGRAQKTLKYFGARVTQSATAFSTILNALDFMQGPREIFIAGDLDDPKTQELIRAVWRNPDPNRVIAVVTPGIEKLLPPAAGKTKVDGKPAAYVCKNFTCKAPVTEADALK